MFLSFIVPVYNTEEYLAECLDSLLRQDIPESEYEIICINDGSTDGSGAILQQYQEKHRNLRIIEQPNRGVAAARNAGLETAQGEYIWFVDSDDLVKPNCLIKINQQIEAKKPERIKIGTYIFEGNAADYTEQSDLKVNSHFYDSSVWNSILLREFLKKHDCRFHYPELTHGEDSIFMFEVVAYKPSCTEMDIPFYYYRKRPGSAMTSQTAATADKKLKSYFLAAKIMKKHYDCGDGEPRDTANMLMSFIWCTMNSLASVSGSKRRTFLKEMKRMHLFPFSRPVECTLSRSYQTTRRDFVGKLFDWIYIHSHTVWGFLLLRLWNRAYGCYQKLRR